MANKRFGQRRIRLILLTGIGAVILVVLGGWAQDARYEHHIHDFRSTVWELQAAVSAGVTEAEYRTLLREARAAQLAARAELSQRDIRRPSWNALNGALWAFERAASDEQTTFREAARALHRADLLRRTWWWKDLPQSLNEIWARPDSLGAS